MKVIAPSEMARIEKIAYDNGASAETFMRNAGHGIALAVQDYIIKHQLQKHVILLCGPGNNGGDAYQTGSYLRQIGYTVSALSLTPFEACSPLCKKKQTLFRGEGGGVKLYNGDERYSFPTSGVILDGLFGTGFHGVLAEPYTSLVREANHSGLPILAIDIPSGLDGTTGIAKGEVIRAAATFFLQLPKTGFFLGDGWNYVGELHCVEFGLPPELIQEAQTYFSMATTEMVRPLLPQIVRNRHKYQRGYVVGVGGSSGMPGAPLLSSLAALRGGAGIVRLLHPEGMQAELTSGPYEVIREAFNPERPEAVLNALKHASAAFIGPGMGRAPITRKFLKSLCPQIEKPCIFDGDGLSIIAEEGINLPIGAVLTPHHGEMERLLKNGPILPLGKELLHTCQQYAEKNKIILVLKGAPTFIFHSGIKPIVSTRGSPGMATAGSGDVLTGLIGALLAQKLSPEQASLLGVYLHGIAGEAAAASKTPYCMIASDIISHFPEAFDSLYPH